MTGNFLEDMENTGCELHASRGHAKELTAELDALCARMSLMEEHNNALVSSLTEAETEKNVLQDLHEKLQQNYEREQKDHTDMMGKFENCTNALIKSLREAEDEKKALRDLHEKLQLKQQNYEREPKDHVNMMGKLLEEMENTSLLATRDLEQLKETIIMKENCAKALIEENTEMKSVDDVNRKEIEILLTAQRELLQKLAIREMYVFFLSRKRSEGLVKLPGPLV
jgi:chromosome segregation ATPase